MTRTEIEEKVRNFLIEDLEIDEEKITPDAKLKDDMGIDSLDFVDIVVDQAGRDAGSGHFQQILRLY